MSIEPNAPGWNAMQAAVMAELSEAHAYSALARTASAAGCVPTVEIVSIANGVALRCPGDRHSTLFNRVLGLGLNAPFESATAAAVQVHFAQCEGPWGLELAPVAAHEGIRELLKQMRLRRSLPTAMLAIDCTRLPPDPSKWRVQRVEPGLADQALNIVKSVFSLSPVVAQVLHAAPTSPEFSLWMAFDGDAPVATCLTHVRRDVAWFGWCATLPSHRRMGLQSALLWHSVRGAAEQGCRWVTAETAIGTAGAPDASYRNMVRFGFVELYRRHGYLCMPRRSAGTGAVMAAPPRMLQPQ